jgi:hypothetical protein
MPISDLEELLRSLSPRLNPGVYVFVSVRSDVDITSLKPIATFVEDDGFSLIVPESQIEGMGLNVLFRAAWITLAVNSDLNAVGLTAVVANALADKGISCNAVAAANHDHLFVPVESAKAAMACLTEVQLKPRLFDEAGLNPAS